MGWSSRYTKAFLLLICHCLCVSAWNCPLSGTQQEDQWDCGHEEDQTWIWGRRGGRVLNNFEQSNNETEIRCLQLQSARSPCWKSCSTQTLSPWRMCWCRRPNSTSSLSFSPWTSRSTWTQMCQRFGPSTCKQLTLNNSGWSDGPSASEILHLPAASRTPLLPPAQSASQVSVPQLIENWIFMES